MARDLRTSLIAVVVLTLLFGLAYPLAMTGVSQVVFSDKADGSRVERDGKVVGSRLIGQDFRGDASFFQSRPSATQYDGDGTFFNNLGPNSKDLRDLFAENLKAYLDLERPFNPGLTAADVPPDAVQTTASGLDPHISEANARIQARRIADGRGIALERVNELIEENTDDRALGVLGEPGVNVLELNLAIGREAS